MMASTTLQDTIRLETDPLQTKTNNKRYLIVFITGNPGLIEYYRAFLTHLFALLNTTPSPQFDIYGSSLVGFEFTTPRWRDLGLAGRVPPFSLDEVIDAVERDVWREVGAGGYEGVIVMGHSLGAYIALEVVQRHRRRLEDGVGEVRVVGGVCLFPTVIDIAGSERGKMLSALTNLPFFASIIPLLCSLILTIIPTFLIHQIVSRIDGLHGHAAAATTAFLKSPHGVSQALYMGRDEMRQISTDKWDSEIWGAAHPSKSDVLRPKLFFYFGERDHWVADRTREDIIALRGRGAEEVEYWKPKMEIDGRGIPHGFCISHSIPVAEKVKEYIDEIVEHERG